MIEGNKKLKLFENRCRHRIPYLFKENLIIGQGIYRELIIMNEKFTFDNLENKKPKFTCLTIESSINNIQETKNNFLIACEQNIYKYDKKYKRLVEIALAEKASNSEVKLILFR